MTDMLFDLVDGPLRTATLAAARALQLGVTLGDGDAFTVRIPDATTAYNFGSTMSALLAESNDPSWQARARREAVNPPEPSRGLSSHPPSCQCRYCR